MRTVAGRATAARGPGRRPPEGRVGDLLGVDRLQEALARSLRRRMLGVVLDVQGSRRVGRRLILQLTLATAFIL